MLYITVIMNHKDIISYNQIQIAHNRNMELINNSSYSKECEIPKVFFVGLCYYCNLPESPSRPLKQCGGCQLVAYCSRDCQKEHRFKHKYVCKEFPVVNTNNVLHTTRPWKEHINGLQKRAARLPLPEVAKVVFHNPRACNTCHETRPKHLANCRCASVSYCSKRCAKVDKPHKDACRLLGQLSHAYSTSWLDDEPLRDELESYSNTLLYALRSLGKRRLGRENRRLEDITSLDVHIVTSRPLFYPYPWDEFMHQLPKLKQLNLVFIMQESASKPPSNLNYRLSGLSLLRCKDCEAKDRVMTYSVQQMQYHMYFSSPQYTEPDVVVIYGNAQEMSVSNKEDINSTISYSNMTYSPDTVLVLTDATEELLRQGTKAVNVARPVDQLGPPKSNLLRGYNEKDYFTCLRRSFK